MFAVLKHWHPMFGRDMHVPWPPMAPAPLPAPAPYFTFSLLFGNTAGLTTQTYFLDHLTGGAGLTMSKGTDIGSLIPHLGPPSITLPVEYLFSSSKSYFGASTYMGVDNKGVQNSVAVALLVVFNPNLNCGTPLPLPVGGVVAANTHCAAMTLGDFLGGLLNMGLEFALQVGINTLVGLGGKLAQSAASRLGYRYFASKAAAKMFLRALGGTKGSVINAEARRVLATSRPGARLVESTANAVLGFFMGSPTGADLGAFGGPTPYGAVHDYFDPPVTGDPSAPPPTPTFGDFFGPGPAGDGGAAEPSDGGTLPGGLPSDGAAGAPTESALDGGVDDGSPPDMGSTGEAGAPSQSNGGASGSDAGAASSDGGASSPEGGAAGTAGAGGDGKGPGDGGRSGNGGGGEGGDGGVGGGADRGGGGG